jgi:hypothetical protein
VGGVPIDRNAGIRFEGLIPGHEVEASAMLGYRVIAHVNRDVTAAAGEVKDLGDLKVIVPRPDADL